MKNTLAYFLGASLTTKQKVLCLRCLEEVLDFGAVWAVRLREDDHRTVGQQLLDDGDRALLVFALAVVGAHPSRGRGRDLTGCGELKKNVFSLFVTCEEVK